MSSEPPIISYHYQTEIPDPISEKSTNHWLINLAKDEGKNLGELSIVICDDEYLLEINQRYLNHNYYTDIISFPYGNDPIEGELYISVDRVMENAKKAAVTSAHELHRVIAHGLLHLCGYSDGTEDEKKLMRAKEDHYLQIFFERR